MPDLNVERSAEFRVERTQSQRAAKYERFVEKVRAKYAEKEFRARVRAEIEATKAVAPGSVHKNTFLTAFGLAYSNEDFIGEDVMPVIPVDHLSDSYAIWPKREIHNFPEDLVGPEGNPNEIESTRDSGEYALKGRALLNKLSWETFTNADDVFNELLDLVSKPLYGLAFKREKRIATIANNTANYGGNSTPGTLWDATNSNPIANIMAAKRTLFHGDGNSDVYAWTNGDVWAVLSQHPAVRELFKYTTDGLATQTQLARFLGLKDIFIGDAREDTANIGQPSATYARMWGKHFALFRAMRNPSRQTAAWGATFRKKGMPMVEQWNDPKPGVHGVLVAKAGCLEDHKVIAPDTSYILTSVIS